MRRLGLCPRQGQEQGQEQGQGQGQGHGQICVRVCVQVVVLLFGRGTHRSPKSVPFRGGASAKPRVPEGRLGWMQPGGQGRVRIRNRFHRPRQSQSIQVRPDRRIAIANPRPNPGQWQGKGVREGSPTSNPDGRLQACGMRYSLGWRPALGQCQISPMTNRHPSGFELAYPQTHGGLAEGATCDDPALTPNF